jgi:hypothetical protein
MKSSNSNASHSYKIWGLVRFIVGRFIAGSFYRRVMSTESLIETWNFMAGHKKLSLFCFKNFFFTTRRYWKASFTEIYLIENVIFIQAYFGGLIRFTAARFITGRFIAEPVCLQFSKTSFSMAPDGDKKLFTTQSAQFSYSDQKLYI